MGACWLGDSSSGLLMRFPSKMSVQPADICMPGICFQDGSLSGPGSWCWLSTGGLSSSPLAHLMGCLNVFTTGQLASLRVSHPRESERSWEVVYGLASEMTWCHFCHVISVMQVSLKQRGKRLDKSVDTSGWQYLGGICNYRLV